METTALDYNAQIQIDYIDQNQTFNIAGNLNNQYADVSTYNDFTTNTTLTDGKDNYVISGKIGASDLNNEYTVTKNGEATNFVINENLHSLIMTALRIDLANNSISGETPNYCEIFNINNKKLLFNTNNGAMIALDLSSYNKVILFKKKKDLSIFSEEEVDLLIDQEFLVNSKFDEEIKSRNKLTYSISKYSSEKESVKIDFAITNLCNFCCPYCFEKGNLNKKESCFSNLIKTSEYLYQYIDKVTLDYVKDLKIVYYGGEPTLEKNL